MPKITNQVHPTNTPKMFSVMREKAEDMLFDDKKKGDEEESDENKEKIIDSVGTAMEL